MSASGNRSPEPALTGRLPPPVPSTTPEAPIPVDTLAARHERLAAEVAQLQWDLGGLAYEMAVRDHFRLDVLVRGAARMQQADAELGELERLLHLRERGAAGTCQSCGALRSRAAAYCWSCGVELMPVAQVAA